MISDKDLPELEDYRRLEEKLPISSFPAFGPLVVATDHDGSPVHRWFKYKEAYSAGLLKNILSHAGLSRSANRVLLDPYCGVGTSLLSAQTNPGLVSSAVGIERNPFVAFVARTKLGWPAIEIQALERIGIEALLDSSAKSAHLPDLSSIRTGRCISKHIAGRLLSIRDTILRLPESATRNALLLGLAAAIEPLSRVRKDGRALRLVKRSYQQVLPIVMQKWTEIQNDVSCMQDIYKEIRIKTRVQEGDGRELEKAGITSDSVDVVLTSPPYPNNIDYSEVYKLELWMLGFVNSHDEFLSLRKSTFRSHPSSALNILPNADFLDAIKSKSLVDFFHPLIERTESYKEKWRNRLVLGYFSDLWQSLREQFRCLRPGGHTFLVLGNSLHGSAGKAYLVPTDLLVAQLSKYLGFELMQILIARNTRRRLSGNHFLRESIIMLRKPENV